jgi:hypothetical protein
MEPNVEFENSECQTSRVEFDEKGAQTDIKTMDIDLI